MQIRLSCEEVLRAGMRTVAKANVIVSFSICQPLFLHSDIQQMTNVKLNISFPVQLQAIVQALAVATSGRKQGLVYIRCLTAAAKITLLQGGEGTQANIYLQRTQVTFLKSKLCCTADSPG